MDQDRNFTYDPQLESDQFWSDMRALFTQWQDEDQIQQRFEIEGEVYKVRMVNIEEVHGKQAMVFEIILRTPNNGH